MFNRFKHDMNRKMENERIVKILAEVESCILLDMEETDYQVGFLEGFHSAKERINEYTSGLRFKRGRGVRTWRCHFCSDIFDSGIQLKTHLSKTHREAIRSLKI